MCVSKQSPVFIFKILDSFAVALYFSCPLVPSFSHIYHFLPLAKLIPHSLILVALFGISCSHTSPLPRLIYRPLVVSEVCYLDGWLKPPAMCVRGIM